MIDKKEKSAHGAATPLGTLLNKQEQYNTDQKKTIFATARNDRWNYRLDRLARARCSVCIR